MTKKHHPRFHFLDGVRGLAALYIVFHHIWLFSFSDYDGRKQPMWFHILDILKFGHDAVSVFIVLSGFCLMLPVAKGGQMTLNGSFRSYIFRRGLRILPPYYAALLLSIAAVYFVPLLKKTHDLFSMNPGVNWWPAILSHLFLIQNLSGEWAYRFDSPMWSVATEWQIYFLFPLLLLPIARKIGIPMTAVVGFAIGCVSLIPQLSFACYWYIGSYAIGMLSSVIASRYDANNRKTKEWGWLTAGLWIVWVAGQFLRIHVFNNDSLLAEFVTDICATFASGSMLVYLAFQAHDFHHVVAKPGIIYKIVSSRLAVWIGGFSYSIYLLHYSFLIVICQLTMKWAHSTPMLFLIQFAFVVPIIAVAYCFHIYCERPFMNNPPAAQA